MLRITTILLFCALAVASGTELQQRQRAGGLLLTDDPLHASVRAIHAGNLDEARLLAEFARDTAGDDRERAAADRVASSIDEVDTFGHRARRFASGALTGEPRDLAGFLGSLSLDLFLVGDLRDIAVQGYREVRTGDGDMLILALSGIGLVTTLSPQFDFAPAMLKTLRRAGALSERFVKSLSKMAQTAIRTGDYRRLGDVVADFGRTARALGPAPMTDVVKYIDHPAELARFSRQAVKYPAAVYGMTRLGKRRAVKILDRTTNASTTARAARRGSRAGKIFAKGAKSIPDWALALLLAVSGFLVLRLSARLLAGGWNRGENRSTKNRQRIDESRPQPRKTTSPTICE